MEQIVQQIEAYKQEIEALPVTDAKSLEDYRIKFLGTKGIVKGLMGEMKNVPNDEKKAFGQVMNEFKQFTEAKYEQWKENTAGSPVAGTADIDISLPGDLLPLGSRHPISLMRNKMIEIFSRLGFAVADGPKLKMIFTILLH